jgi:DeoR family transcriptional regulator, suf operon transcriptional repressor
VTHVLGPALAGLPTTRRAILVTLKKRGEAAADELAEELGITVSAVRQHLSGLQADGWVAYTEVKGRPGRPRHLYGLTPTAEALFPRAYGDLTNELLDYVGDEDPDLLPRIFERRRRARVERAKARLDGRRLDEQVVELAGILDEDGYLAEAVPIGDGAFRIVEHNCAILSVALRYGVACGSELEFIREVLPEASVERVSHMMAGAHTCAYEVRPRTS